MVESDASRRMAFEFELEFGLGGTLGQAESFARRRPVILKFVNVGNYSEVHLQNGMLYRSSRFCPVTIRSDILSNGLLLDEWKCMAQCANCANTSIAISARHVIDIEAFQILDCPARRASGCSAHPMAILKILL